MKALTSIFFNLSFSNVSFDKDIHFSNVSFDNDINILFIHSLFIDRHFLFDIFCLVC